MTPLTPFQSHIPLDVKLGYGGGEVRLLPVTLGKGERLLSAALRQAAEPDAVR